jgi:NAD(P)-dependent dehydrogenase (short-subunit alcohol dehydrogenase family)
MTSAARNLTQRFPKRRAFITGAASGLGLACAETLAREGWQLFVTDVDAARLDLVAQSFRRDGAQVMASACDVRDAAAVQALVDAAVGVAGGIDLAIHCAGVSVSGRFHETPPEDWDWCFDINVHGVVNSCRAVLRHMARGQGGIIINIASVAGFCSGPQMSAYNASKAAVISLSETLMQEYGAYGVHTMAVMPAFFRTNIVANGRGPARVQEAAQKLVAGSGIEASEVAEAVLMAASRGRTHLVYPPKYHRLWWLKRFMPQRWHQVFPRLFKR